MAGVVVSALLLACLTSAGCSAGTIPQSVDRRSLVWVNALAVARPDYHVVHEEQLPSRSRLEHRDAVRVVVEPRWPTWSHTEVFGRQVLELRPHEGGDVSLPDLPAWNLTEAIHALSFDAEAREQATAEAEARLDELAQVKDLKVTIVVGFTEPLQESEVRQLWKGFRTSACSPRPPMAEACRYPGTTPDTAMLAASTTATPTSGIRSPRPSGNGRDCCRRRTKAH
ncbi:hypothetical protein [Nonomuraea sp. NPDC050202]|uniref:hypothetical protein n=1 Tax=Nonomuraea sp. NPDC050202 TaxID=3155035 RepID=UPI0033F9AB89